MRTAPDHLRRGVATALLGTIIAAAIDRGYGRLSLETGSAAAFAPVRTLYVRFGSCRAARSATTRSTRSACS